MPGYLPWSDIDVMDIEIMRLLIDIHRYGSRRKGDGIGKHEDTKISFQIRCHSDDTRPDPAREHPPGYINIRLCHLHQERPEEIDRDQEEPDRVYHPVIPGPAEKVPGQGCTYQGQGESGNQF
jgi:hypothetical protein